MIKAQIAHYTKRIDALTDDIDHISHKMSKAEPGEAQELKAHRARLIDEKLNYIGRLEEIQGQGA